MVQKPFFWGLVLGYASPITWATDAWRFQVGHPSKKYPPSHCHFSIKHHHEIPIESHEITIKSHEIIMKPSWNYHEIIMKSHGFIMKSTFLKHLHALRSMTWLPTWPRLGIASLLLGSQALWNQVPTGHRKRKARRQWWNSRPLGSPWVPLGPLGSPWARKKIQIGHGFFVGFQEKSGI